MVSAGMHHTVLLRSDGVAVACGMNCFGQCDIPPLPKRMTYNYPGFVRRNAHSVRPSEVTGKLWRKRKSCSWITPNSTPDNGRTYTHISTGWDHTVLLSPGPNWICDNAIAWWFCGGPGSDTRKCLASPCSGCTMTFPMMAYSPVGRHRQCHGKAKAWKEQKCQKTCDNQRVHHGVSLCRCQVRCKHRTWQRQSETPWWTRWNPQMMDSSHGEAVACTNNYDRQCDMPPLQHGITYTQVSAGTNHTVLLRSDGVAVACGRVGKGQCDIPPLPDRMTYTQVFAGHDVHTILLRVMGRLRSVVEIFKFNATFHPCLTKWHIPSYTQVSASDDHTVLLRSDGFAVACGSNSHGQCNISTLDPGTWYVDAELGRDLVLQLDCACQDETLLLTFCGLTGDEVTRLNARPFDPAWDTQKRIARELRVPLQSLWLVVWNIFLFFHILGIIIPTD